MRQRTKALAKPNTGDVVAAITDHYTELEDMMPALIDRKWIPVTFAPGTPPLMVGYSFAAATGENFDWMNGMQEQVARLVEESENAASLPDAAEKERVEGSCSAKMIEIVRDQTYRFLEMVGLEWHLRRGGVEVPTDTASLKSVPYVAVRKVYDAIMADCRPNPTGAQS